MTGAVTAADVKKLREQTGAGMMDAKTALAEAQGDFAVAVDILRRKGVLKAGKKFDREAREGVIEAYIHGDGRIGVLVEVNCETDFVARNEEFKALVHDLALHIAASAPLYVSREQVPADVLAKEKAIYGEEAAAAGKPGALLEKIVAGKIEKFYSEICLLDQSFVKDEDIVIKDLINQKIATIGENIQVRRFVRYILGE